MELVKIPRNTKEEKYSKEREDFSHAFAGHLIALTSIGDKNVKAFTHREVENYVRWIARGEELNFRINPNIFKSQE